MLLSIAGMVFIQSFAELILNLGCYATPSKASRGSIESCIDALQLETSNFFAPVCCRT